MIDESILSRINEQISPISSPSSTFSQEVLTPASSHCRGVRVSQASTPSSPSSELHDLKHTCLPSQTVSAQNVLVNDLMAYGFGGSDGNSLHLSMTSSMPQDVGNEQASSTFYFSQAFGGYTSARSAEDPLAQTIVPERISSAAQPEHFYPTPNPTPQRAIAPLPHREPRRKRTALIPTSMHASAQSPLRPVRAAAVAAKRKASFTDAEEDEDDYKPPAAKRRKTPSPFVPPTSTLRHSTSRGSSTLSSKKTQQKKRKGAKITWEEDMTVEPGVPVLQSGKVLDDCQWGVPVYTVCPENSAKSIRWRCNGCSALLGRRPDLHRHWKNCFRNDEFSCGEVTREYTPLTLSVPSLDLLLPIDEDGRVWPGCGTVCSRQDAARRHIERRFTHGHCSLTKPNRVTFKTNSAYEKHLAIYNDMLINSTWRAALPIAEKNRLAHSALPGMKTDIFKD